MLKNTINIFNKILLTFCVLSLSILVVITVIDVFGRYLLGLPLPGTSEITEIILAILVYIGLPFICRDEGHVTVSILSNNLKHSFAKIHSIIINMILSIILSIIGLQLIFYGINLNSYNDITTFLEIPKAPIAFTLAFLTLLASLMNFLNCYDYYIEKKLFKTESAEEKMYPSYKQIKNIKPNLTDVKDK